MKLTILTTLPELLSPLQHSIAGRACQSGALQVEIINLRNYSARKHKNTDDTPFGGGAGMVMLAQPIMDAMAAVGAAWRVYLSPKGNVLTHKKARELAQKQHLVLLCGHYEGVDQRALDSCIDEELSIGDYVLTGGELAALIVCDAVMRFVPGVLGSAESAGEDSFSNGLLEYPQYTRPADFRGMSVPAVLQNGNHADIARWRREQQLLLTAARRPDLLKTAPLSPADWRFLLESGAVKRIPAAAKLAAKEAEKKRSKF